MRSFTALRSFTAIRKDAGLFCGPRLRKGEVFAYVGLPQNLKDLKEGLQMCGMEVFSLIWLSPSEKRVSRLAFKSGAL